MTTNSSRFALVLLCLLAAAPATAGVLGSYSSEVTADNPVSYWRFEETSGSTATDSAGSNNGTYTGGVTLGQSGAAAIGGSSADFDGSTGYVDVPGTWGGATWDAVSVEAWVALESTTSAQYRLQAVTATGGGFVHMHTQGAPRGTGNVVYRDGGGFSDMESFPELPLNQWRHFVVVGETGNSRAYLDGFPHGVVDGNALGYVTPSTTVRIGGRDNGGSGDRWLDGNIDEVAFYDTALTDQRVLDHYTAAQPDYVKRVYADEPFAHFRLSEPSAASGDSASNLVLGGQDYTGTYSAALTDVAVPYHAGFVGKEFDGATTSVAMPNLQPLQDNPGLQSQVTFEFLIRPDAYPTGSDIQAIYATASTTTHLNIKGDSLQLASSGNSSHPVVEIASHAPAGEWSHIVATYDAGLMEVFVNGTSVGTATAGSGASLSFNTTGWLGEWNGIRHFDGALADFAIYEGVLTPQQISTHYGIAIPEPGTVALLLTALAIAAAIRRRVL